MHFLSLESSTKNFGLALNRDQRVLVSRTSRTHTLLENSIIPAIENVLKSQGKSLGDLDAFVVGLGPGSFTSLRVGLATVKAFSLALDKPVVGVCTLDVIAQGCAALDCDQVCVLVDARRSQVYAGLYRKTSAGLSTQAAPKLCRLEEILEQVRGKTLFVGDGLAVHRQAIQDAYASARQKCRALFAAEKFWFPNPRCLAKLGLEKLRQKNFENPGTLVPLYLYAHDCQVAQNSSARSGLGGHRP